MQPDESSADVTIVAEKGQDYVGVQQGQSHDFFQKSACCAVSNHRDR